MIIPGYPASKRKKKKPKLVAYACHQHLGAYGKRSNMGLRPAWATVRPPPSPN